MIILLRMAYPFNLTTLLLFILQNPSQSLPLHSFSSPHKAKWVAFPKAHYSHLFFRRPANLYNLCAPSVFIYWLSSKYQLSLPPISNFLFAPLQIRLETVRCLFEYNLPILTSKFYILALFAEGHLPAMMQFCKNLHKSCNNLLQFWIICLGNENEK